jgi:hypothetical protein
MVASFVPGPIVVNGISIPLGDPVFVLMAEVLPASGISTLTLVVPDLPPAAAIEISIATVDIYAATVVVSPDNRTFQVSDQFTLSITDEDTTN